MSKVEIDNEMEEKLNRVLNPVLPRNNYVEELQKKLTSSTDVIIEYPNYAMIILILSSGLAFGVALVFLLSKLFKSISREK
jgi:short subunit fatty acids transporter